MIGLYRMDKTSVGQFRLFVVNVLLANTVKELESAHLDWSLSGITIPMEPSLFLSMDLYKQQGVC